MSNPELITGTVKWFNTEKGFGFITTADNGDVFVHVRALPEGVTTLTVGEPVYFRLRQTEKGPEAANVRPGVPPPPPKPALPTVELETPAMPSSISMRIVGRPAEMRPLGQPDQPPSLVACVFEFGGETAVALPGGLPQPSAATACLVLMAAKHWPPVARALEQDPEDTLVVDGYGSLDPLVPGMITLRATSATTSATLQAKWDAHLAQRESQANQQDAATAAEAEQPSADVEVNDVPAEQPPEQASAAVELSDA